jgi:Fur family iron response transcriptional regulator
MLVRTQSKQVSDSDLVVASGITVGKMLRSAGLRPTVQRISLASMLFANQDRHVTAEMLYQEAAMANLPVTLATVYNTLHKFADVGLLRQIKVNSSKTYFDTNVSSHHHFFVEGANLLVDIPGAEIIVDKVPPAPDGYEIARVEIVLRLKRKDV